jgi:hypothetical protein
MKPSEAVEIARAANRPDLVEQIETLPVVPTTDVASDRQDLSVGIRPDTREVNVTRWDLPDGPVWLCTVTLVDWGGGDASVDEDLMLTEYDLSRPEVMAAVAPILIGQALSPGRYIVDWTATNTQERIRHDGDLERLRTELDTGLRVWIEAVSALRRLDSRPLPPPVRGWREL